MRDRFGRNHNVMYLHKVTGIEIADETEKINQLPNKRVVASTPKLLINQNVMLVNKEGLPYYDCFIYYEEI